MRFLIDQNVQDSVSTTLRGLGHDVVLVREVLSMDAPDPLVAATAERESRILVSHDGDFRRLSHVTGRADRARFPRLSCIHLKCREEHAAERMRGFMREIEWEVGVQAERDPSGMFLTISESFFMTAR